MSIEIKATVLALAASLGLLGLTFGLSPFLQEHHHLPRGSRLGAATRLPPV